MCGIFLYSSFTEENNREDVRKSFETLIPRGPDSQVINVSSSYFLGFCRLSIMDPSSFGEQPFSTQDGKYSLICNGEIYNYLELQKEFNLSLSSGSDCEVLLPLFEHFLSTGLSPLESFRKMVSCLDAEFALLLRSNETGSIFAARDSLSGIRPLFYSFSPETILLASEAKAIHSLTKEKILPFPPDQIFHFYSEQGKWYLNTYENSEEKIQRTIQTLLTEAVKKRLHADRPIGFLLSGGLDSSLITAIATRILGPEKITCFTIGLAGSVDVEAAKKVTKYLGIEKHFVYEFSIEEGFDIIPKVIQTIESFDVTTIRASTPQYLLAKKISEETEIKVILSGEGADELLGGYREFRSAPSPEDFQKGCEERVKNLYRYDNLRTDRVMASQSLEVRLPFLDHLLAKYLLSIDPSLKMSSRSRIEKKIVRDAFVGYLPNEILYRSKEAFSDAVSSKDVSWYREVEKRIPEIENEEFTTESIKPLPTKEAIYYFSLFQSYYPGRENLIGEYWLPKFQDEIIHDPSATVLKEY